MLETSRELPFVAILVQKFQVYYSRPVVRNHMKTNLQSKLRRHDRRRYKISIDALSLHTVVHKVPLWCRCLSTQSSLKLSPQPPLTLIHAHRCNTQMPVKYSHDERRTVCPDSVSVTASRPEDAQSGCRHQAAHDSGCLGGQGASVTAAGHVRSVHECTCVPAHLRSTPGWLQLTSPSWLPCGAAPAILCHTPHSPSASLS